MSSRIAAIALLGLASAEDGLRLFSLQPAVQPAVQSVQSYPVVMDAPPQPLFMEAGVPASEGSSAGTSLLACTTFGLLGYALARYASKPATAAPRAAPTGQLVTAPALGALAPKIAMAAVSGRRRQTQTGSSKPGKSAITLGDIGTTKPLGVFDPLQLMNKMPDKYRRYQEMEIKHGRQAMAACLHVFVTEAGFRWPGYLSIAEDIKFSDMPGGTIASWAALPNLAWAQIVLIIALFDNSVLAQDPAKEPGDVGGPLWVRYDDVPGQSGKEWKLNAERNNGRAAMMGITGMIIHEALTGNPLFPIGVPAQPILEDLGSDIEKGPARVGSFVLASLGMATVGFIASVPEFTKQDAKAAAR